ncbi:lipoprotein [Streptomyces thermocarboxydovorans]|uniref:Lipoprotein n=1 Tax=Streptomyces thermocarboxydovorans TaxID=59298 RepID=A0ABN1HG89_9ACTN
MKLTRPMLALSGAAAILALAGCGSGGEGEAAPPKEVTGSLEHIAAEAKCKPNMQTDADTIRQAICKRGEQKYILATFATDRGQREWLNSAKDYGGYYLVGRKWVAVGEEKTVEELRSVLGGTLEEGSEHMNPGGSHNKGGSGGGGGHGSGGHHG